MRSFLELPENRHPLSQGGRTLPLAPKGEFEQDGFRERASPEAVPFVHPSLSKGIEVTDIEPCDRIGQHELLEAGDVISEQIAFGQSDKPRAIS